MLLPPGCAQGLAQLHGVPGKGGAQAWHTGTPPSPSSWPHQRPRGKRRILGADSGAEPGKAGLLCPHTLMWGMRVLGAEWESQGCHGARVSMVNTQPNSGNQKG